MKALNLLMLLLLFLVVNSFAQVKHPFPNKDGEWIESYWGQDGASSTFKFYVEKDTIINKKSYSIIDQYEMPYARCALRSDSFKVYARNIDDLGESEYFQIDTNEYVLYDYNLKVNDRFKVPNFSFGGWSPERPDSMDFTVVKVDSIKIGKEFRKRLELTAPMNHQYWIDGIGSSIAPIYQAYMTEFEEGYKLNCYHEKGNRVFGNKCEPDYVNVPFPNKEGVWYIKTKREGDKNWFLQPYPDKVEKDTTINNQPYSILKSDAFGYRCAIRNDYPKYYYIDLKHQERGENLLYDFGLVSGDSIKLVHFQSNGHSDTIQWYADQVYYNYIFENSIDIVLVNNYKDGLYPRMIWQKGFGSSSGPVYPLTPSFVGNLFEVYCYKEDGYPTKGDCSTTRIIMPIDLSFRSYYVSKQNRLLVEGQFDEFDLVILDTSGRAVYKQMNCCDNLIDLSTLKRGVYVCKFSIGNNSFSQKIRVE